MDVKEGKNAGCLYAIAITTGAFTREELLPYEPSFIIDDMKELLPIIEHACLRDYVCIPVVAKKLSKPVSMAAIGTMRRCALFACISACMLFRNPLLQPVTRLVFSAGRL